MSKSRSRTKQNGSTQKQRLRAVAAPATLEYTGTIYMPFSISHFSHTELPVVQNLQAKKLCIKF